jgi:prepilin peptidase CpaA
MIPLSVYAVLFIELLLVSYGDVRQKKISNIWSLVNIGLYIILLFAFPSDYEFSWNSLVFPMAFLFVGFFLFALKIMGGGDSKYLFSFFLLIPEKLHEEFFLCLIYLTIFVGGFLFLLNTIKNFAKLKEAIKYKSAYSIKQIYGKRFTYAPVIGLSWVCLGIWVKDRIYF